MNPPAIKSNLEWNGWLAPLRQFAEASGLVLAAYDAAGVRKLGPLCTTRTALFLENSRLWHADGPGTEFERNLVANVVAHKVAAETAFLGCLRVNATPLVSRGDIYGVIIYGWTFQDFSSPMECEQVGRTIDLPGHLLWNEVRLEVPVSASRMAIYRALLGTLIGSIDRERDTIAELNQTNRARELFFATVAHEMRTPLSAIAMRVEFMARSEKALSESAARGLDSIRKHVAQESRMVEDLVDAGRTLTGQMTIDRSTVSIVKVIADALLTVELSAMEKGIAIELIKDDEGSEHLVEGDSRRLLQVFWNLLVNAIKFTDRNGRIRVQVNRLNGREIVSVSDNGRGISAAELPHIFDAFKLQRTGNINGLGLGLYIAWHLVELHGGTLSAASDGEGLGTSFVVSLPEYVAGATPKIGTSPQAH